VSSLASRGARTLKAAVESSTEAELKQFWQASSTVTSTDLPCQETLIFLPQYPDLVLGSP